MNAASLRNVILCGDVREQLRRIPDETVNCVVTSPPYWGLRDYGVEGQVWGGEDDCEHLWGDVIVENATNHTGKARWQHTRNGRDEEQPTEKRVAWLRTAVPQGKYCEHCGAWAGSLGLEPTPEMFTAHMVDVFREVRRVLRKDGTLWLNLGDSYAGNRGNSDEKPGTDNKAAGGHVATYMPKLVAGLKPKDLVGIPWRVAFALQADGWWLRSDIIWSKPNPMPESVTDRPTKAHEYVFLLTKSERYYYDADAIREDYAEASIARISQPNFENQKGGPKDYGPDSNRSQRKTLENFATSARPQTQRAVDLFERAGLTDEHMAAIKAVGITDVGKAQVTQDGYGKNAPEIQALADEAKSVLGGYYREFLLPKGRNRRTVWEIPTKPYPEAHFATYPEELVKPCILAGCPEGGIVLDPFLGSGTTASVAKTAGRDWIGIELNPAYVELAKARINVDQERLL